MNKRTSGILLHITSLPSPYGIGDLGPAAHHFVDSLVKAKQRLWQILPVNPTDGINGHSPYSSYSAYAGNPLLISPDRLIGDGWLKKADLRGAPKFKPARVHFSVVMVWKEKLLRRAFVRFQEQAADNQAFGLFCDQHNAWLDDFALFSVAKRQFKGRPWSDWPKIIKWREQRSLKNLTAKHAQQIRRVKFEQFLFYKQWEELKSYCAVNNVRIIGDMPIYVNYDSADVWSDPKLFKLDKNLKLKFVSGVPPDYFSSTGQRWGNPVYDWAQARKTGYDWWIKRIEHNLKMFDFVRIDHFRGFAGFWQIPAHEKTAVNGRWVKAPGQHFFRTLYKKMGKLPLIAEDLGYITPDVIRLVKRFKLPGMRVLLFAFDDYSRSNLHHPDNYTKNLVVYTGTHDNNTVAGWYQKNASWHAKENVARHLNGHVHPKDIHWDFIRIVMNSAANTAVVPMQDVLGLGDEARINRPSTTECNWEWRMKPNAFKVTVIKKLAQITKAANRD